MNHKWFANKQLWDDLRFLETTVGERYITHEAEDEFWLKGGEMTLQIHTSDTDTDSSSLSGSAETSQLADSTSAQSLLED